MLRVGSNGAEFIPLCPDEGVLASDALRRALTRQQTFSYSGDGDLQG